METQTKLPTDAPEKTLPQEQSSAPNHLWKLDRGDVLPFVILIGSSAWLWSHASASLGNGAAFLGAAIGLGIAFLVRAFC
jgi:hypothetical protein